MNHFEPLRRDSECCHAKAGGRLGTRNVSSAVACANACLQARSARACHFFEFSSPRACVLCAGCQLKSNRSHLFGKDVWARKPLWGTTEETDCAARPAIRAPRLSVRPAPPAPVAISLAVHESDAWVEVLIENALAFSASRTSVMLHLNSLTTYAPCLLRRWNGSMPGRLGVAAERYPVRWGTGSVLWAHLANARAIARRWPSTRYVVLQASDMVWVRPGMEARVVALQTSASMQAARGSQGRKALRMQQQTRVFAAILNASRGGEPTQNYHEGSFYPTELLLRFRAFLWAELEQAAEQQQQSTAPIATDAASRLLRSSVLEQRWLADEFWLPTYALHAEWMGSHRAADSQLCYRNDSSYDIARLPHCVGPRDVEAIQRGKLGGYYAVKRVRRAAGGYIVDALLHGDGRMPPREARTAALDEQLRCRTREEVEDLSRTPGTRAALRSMRRSVVASLEYPLRTDPDSVGFVVLVVLFALLKVVIVATLLALAAKAICGRAIHQ